MIRDFFLGFIKIHILYHASQEPIYGLDFIHELEEHGYQISPGTLYPIFHNLEQQGYLTSEKKIAGGKVRKYYIATKQGKNALVEAYSKARELLNEISNIENISLD
jgi:DNA-binding PadR family transcriptional regulator